jgi:hypothetical protein
MIWTEPDHIHYVQKVCYMPEQTCVPIGVQNNPQVVSTVTKGTNLTVSIWSQQLKVTY